MARKSAINAVADAVVATLNVSAMLTLCPGGIYRGRPNAQEPPYISVTVPSSVPDDAFGWNLGAVLTIMVKAVTSGADANGSSRANTIIDKAMELLDEASHLSMTGWTPLLIDVVHEGEPEPDLDAIQLGTVAAAATFVIKVRQT